MTDHADAHGEEKKSRPLTRRQAARILKRTESHLRRSYDEELQPEVVLVCGKKRYRYDPLKVAALREKLLARDAQKAAAKVEESSGWTREEGVLAALVFERLRASKTLVDIVIELKVPPEVVRRLREQFRRSFEDDDRARKSGEVLRREKSETREHAREAARIERAERERAAARAARRSEMMGLPPKT
ncbi:MAG: hypothetical protein QUS11_06490 [Candidatus Fermentibacter sp.]|nr:hypothetical protein [Candidatus Fermentibacter sp.]